MNRVLCIDVGNTHTHAGVWENGVIQLIGDLKTAEWGAEPEGLKQLLLKSECRSVAYCSVVPQVREVLESVCCQQGVSVYGLTCEDAGGLKITYPKPQEIGQDRLANALAAQAFYGAPAIVIDMGTAVTFDIVDAEGAYAGGIIAPGIAVMTRYLHEQTALLPKLSEDDLVVSGGIGKSTLEAMRLGCVVGFSGMITALLQSVLSELKAQQEPAIIGTGGSSRSLLRSVHPRLVIDPELTLKGLGEAWRRKQQSVV